MEIYLNRSQVKNITRKQKSRSKFKASDPAEQEMWEEHAVMSLVNTQMYSFNSFVCVHELFTAAGSTVRMALAALNYHIAISKRVFFLNK